MYELNTIAKTVFSKSYLRVVIYPEYWSLKIKYYKPHKTNKSQQKIKFHIKADWEIWDN